MIKPEIEPAAFGRWFAEKGWAHLLLFSFAGLFLFPFLWMVGTSFKTDDELTDDALFPAIPTCQATSPYVRRPPTIHRPADVAAARWRSGLPVLLAEARTAVAAARTGDEPVDNKAWEESAAAFLADRVASRLPRPAWQGDDAALAAACRQLATADEARAALADRLACCELSGLQLKTLDGRIHVLSDGPGIARDWTVESGPGELRITGDTTRLQYHYASSGDAPIVLRCGLKLPPDMKPADLHKLLLSYRADDSWHHLDATYVDADGVEWRSQRTTPLAQHRVASIILQPPTFDDTTDKPRTWVPLRTTGQHLAAGAPCLRIVLSPSGTIGAIWSKVARNYERAFLSVPFWTYVGNSVILVVLVVGGSLFSSAFVAYAFARLKWPGQGVALVILLSTMMLPGQVTMIPSFLVWRTLGWYNTLNPLWVGAWFGNAFFIFLMIQQMKTIPKELEEAARIDGLGYVQTWWYIIVPQVKPTLAGIAIMSFMGAWNDFMGPLIYLRDQSRFPLSLGLYGIRVDNIADFTMIMAGNILMTLPVILIFFFFQRYFIQGMTVTGMK